MADEQDQNYDQEEIQEDQEEQQQEELPLQVQEEEEEDDFPEYANEQNKQLNEIIKEKRRLNKEIRRKIEEKSDRSKVLNEHLKNVQQELLHTQALIDAKNKEIETEDHLKQITERIIGRIETEFQKLEKLSIEQQEKLNDTQNLIFKGNEKMDQFKLEMNWNQEELEQWALAARQKEEDNLTLEKYKRADQVKIKELNLSIERLTADVGKKQSELEREITETQASQIELDKTAEEFRKQHEERHQLFLQWQEVTEIISRRDQSIRETGEEFAKIKMEINSNKDTLEERKKLLKNEKDENKRIEATNDLFERQKIQQITDNKEIQKLNRDYLADVEIKKNQLSAFASDLSNKKNAISILTQDRLVKKQRLNGAKAKYDAFIIKMKNETLTAKQFEKNRETAEERYDINRKELSELEKNIEMQKKILLKHTGQLFKLRESEANLYGDIQSTMANCRNLQAHINNLNQEFQRQQELLYNAEFQIQLLERKVNYARGDRTLEERKDIQREIEEQDTKLKQVKDEHIKISESLKKLDDDLRSIEKRLRVVNYDNEKYDKIVQKLVLENDMTYQDLSKIVKKKEEVLVQNDTMKLEIKKIREKLNVQIDIVFNLENRKYQLEMSMQEREKEIQVHKDVLTTEHKAAEEERHKIAVELAERSNRVKNLKIKYESLVQKNKVSNGEAGNVHEHSQAYYLIQYAQEKEELQRKGDELNAKLLKSEKELKALTNTLNHLKGWNSKYWDSFLNKGVTAQDRDQKDALDEQCRAASENLFKKKKEVQKYQKEYEEDMRRFTEIQNKIEILYNQEREVNQLFEKVTNELQSQVDKIDRAEQQLNGAINRAQQRKINMTEENPHIIQLYFDKESNLTKTLMNALYNISIDIPEIAGIIDDSLKDKKLQLPSKAPSSIDIQSQRGSERSVGSRGSRR